MTLKLQKLSEEVRCIATTSAALLSSKSLSKGLKVLFDDFKTKTKADQKIISISYVCHFSANRLFFAATSLNASGFVRHLVCSWLCEVQRNPQRFTHQAVKACWGCTQMKPQNELGCTTCQIVFCQKDAKTSRFVV